MNLGRELEELEFKKTISELKEGVISLSSMLNKRGHGILYFGVKNNGDIYGQQIGTMTTTNIVNEIKNHLKPFVNPKIDIENYDDKSVVKVEIVGSDSPYSAYGRYYKRCDDQDLEMTQKELEEYFNNKNITYSSWEKTLTTFGEEVVDEDLLISFIEKANEISRMNYRYYSVEDAMTKLGLMENGKLNNAGYYLFSKNKPLLVKLARFATEARTTFIDNRQINGNIFECIDETYKYILASINFNAVIVGMDRIEKPEIPLEAIREIVVNSFAHMRIMDGDYNEVTITPKEVRIYNPGVIAMNKDPMDFASGKIGSKVRNPLIALTLYKNKTIEAFGTGFKRVFDLCKKEGIKYSYNIDGLGFSFVFERNKTNLLRQNDTINDIKNDRINELTKTELELWEYIEKEKRIDNATNVAIKLNKSLITIQRGIKKLVEMGLIERIGSNKTGYWKIIGK